MSFKLSDIWHPLLYPKTTLTPQAVGPLYPQPSFPDNSVSQATAWSNTFTLWYTHSEPSTSASSTTLHCTWLTYFGTPLFRTVDYTEHCSWLLIFYVSHYHTCQVSGIRHVTRISNKSHAHTHQVQNLTHSANYNSNAQNSRTGQKAKSCASLMNLLFYAACTALYWWCTPCAIVVVWSFKPFTLEQCNTNVIHFHETGLW